MRVYPRVYGGTAAWKHGQHFLSGLSPRVRGNLKSYSGSDELERSIPACTGEPFLILGKPVPIQVYPRVYGGTGPVLRPKALSRGLSPRVRGNLLSGLWVMLRMRSIPACTGEPLLSLLDFLPP